MAYTMFDALLAKSSGDRCRADGGTVVPDSYVPGSGVKCVGGSTQQAAELVLGDIAKAQAEAAQAYAEAVTAAQALTDAAKAAAKAAVDAEAVSAAQATGVLPKNEGGGGLAVALFIGLAIYLVALR